MYVWIWRHLSGGFWGKLVLSALMVAAVCAILLFVVFPEVEPLLPFSDVTVDESTGGAPDGS